MEWKKKRRGRTRMDRWERGLGSFHRLPCWALFLVDTVVELSRLGHCNPYLHWSPSDVTSKSTVPLYLQETAQFFLILFIISFICLQLSSRIMTDTKKRPVTADPTGPWSILLFIVVPFIAAHIKAITSIVWILDRSSLWAGKETKELKKQKL